MAASVMDPLIERITATRLLTPNTDLQLLELVQLLPEVDAALDGLVGLGILAPADERGSGPGTAVYHDELPLFVAFREFCGRRDTCGPNALVMALAAIDPLRYHARCADMTQVVAAMQAAGRFSTDPRGVGGCTMSDLVAEARDRGYDAWYPQEYHWHPALTIEHVHQVMKRLRYSQGHAIILQVGLAYQLPNNERGVFSHFVTGAGVDALLGYLMGDGDIPAPIFTGAQWVGWEHVVAAVPTALCIISARGKGVPASFPDQQPPAIYQPLIDAGWSDTASWDAAVFEAVITDPSGGTFTHGYRQDVILHGLDPDDTSLMKAEASDGTVTCKVCVRTTFNWSQATGVFRTPTIPVGRVLAHVLGINSVTSLRAAPEQRLFEGDTHAH